MGMDRELAWVPRTRADHDLGRRDDLIAQHVLAASGERLELICQSLSN